MEGNIFEAEINVENARAGESRSRSRGPPGVPRPLVSAYDK